MTLLTRLRRLEAKAPQGTAAFPRVIFICDGETGDAVGAIWKGEDFRRGEEESAAACEARVVTLHELNRA